LATRTVGSQAVGRSQDTNESAAGDASPLDGSDSWNSEARHVRLCFRPDTREKR
jgi:hypothetical protein